MNRGITRQVIGATAAALVFGGALATARQHADDAQLLSKLSSSRLTLVDGIRQAEKSDGPDAEHNTLMEVIGPATDAAWKPETEIFVDKEHIARSAMQLTLMQLTRMSLADVIKKAEGQQAGTVYSAIPALQGGRPVVDVLVATRDGQTKHVTIELK